MFPKYDYWLLQIIVHNNEFCLKRNGVWISSTWVIRGTCLNVLLFLEQPCPPSVAVHILRDSLTQWGASKASNRLRLRDACYSVVGPETLFSLPFVCVTPWQVGISGFSARDCGWPGRAGGGREARRASHPPTHRHENPRCYGL